jgi:hypothetical protein
MRVVFRSFDDSQLGEAGFVFQPAHGVTAPAEWPTPHTHQALSTNGYGKLYHVTVTHNRHSML